MYVPINMREITPNIAGNYYAELYFCGELDSASIEVPGVFYKVCEGSVSLEKMVYGFTYSNEQLKYEGSSNRPFQMDILAYVSLSDNTGRELILRIVRNAQSIGEASIFASALSYKKIVASFEVMLSPGDFIEVHVANTQGIEKVKIKDLKISLVNKT